MFDTAQSLDLLQKKLDIQFKDHSFFQEALTHSSYLRYLSDDSKHNERLEFLVILF